MENSDPEEFENVGFERMVAFLTMKSKMVAPANNPRIALTSKPRNTNNEYYP